MPRSISRECNDFVDEYGDTIIQFLIEATVPAEICRMMGLCSSQLDVAEGLFKLKLELSNLYSFHS